MNLKIGQILTYKENNATRKVLEVFTNTVVISSHTDHNISAGIYSFKEIEEDYILPKEEWKPEYGNYYFFINASGLITQSTWMGDYTEQARKNFLGIYRTKEDAEKALKDIKNKLGK